MAQRSALVQRCISRGDYTRAFELGWDPSPNPNPNPSDPDPNPNPNPNPNPDQATTRAPSSSAGTPPPASWTAAPAPSRPTTSPASPRLSPPLWVSAEGRGAAGGLKTVHEE